uniref:Mitochondrial ribosomal protein L32 n=1 Tax=Ditylenchus dipsaci TaxID=166011 RepID=A0A915CN50_9BILA
MRFSIRLLGVPKWRTPKPWIMTRKFGQPYMLKKEENVVSCGKCDTPHLITTLCPKCYEELRVETNAIKHSMMSYNQYLGERQKPVKKAHSVDKQCSQKT